jgi:glucokinase
MPKDYTKNKHLILTLDAGGTNFSFAAVLGGEQVGEVYNVSTHRDSLEVSLEKIVSGFQKLIDDNDIAPSAISFAFPGPADYENGVILNEGNLPAFAGGVALGPYLEYKFNIPVFINNDGDLYTYGEACFGVLANLNYKSLVGITLGTGVGAGFYINGDVLRGENSNALEVWTTRNGIDNDLFTEEGLGKRALINHYGDQNLTPLDLYNTATGELEGDRKLAVEAFEKLGMVLGELISDLVSLFDAPVVIGGGVSKSYPLFSKTMMARINGQISYRDGSTKSRVVQKCYFIEDINKMELLNKNENAVTKIPGTEIKINYKLNKSIPIAIGTMGTNKAVQLGAYAFAISNLENKDNKLKKY